MWVFVETHNAVHVVCVRNAEDDIVHDLHFGCDCDFSTVKVDWESVPVVIHSRRPDPFIGAQICQ